MSTASPVAPPSRSRVPEPPLPLLLAPCAARASTDGQAHRQRGMRCNAYARSRQRAAPLLGARAP